MPGLHHGHIDPAGLQWLAAVLSGDTTKPTLLMRHHPPLVCGIPHMDEYRYFDGDALGAVVEQFDNIEIVLCGHVRSAADHDRGDQGRQARPTATGGFTSVTHSRYSSQ